MPTFKRPINIQETRNSFGLTEVGLTHPYHPSFVKLNDNGGIEIFAKEGLGIIIDPNTNSINFFADHVKFFTKDMDGVRWNRLSFNHKATTYTEPAFVDYEADSTSHIYRGVDELFASEE